MPDKLTNNAGDDSSIFVTGYSREYGGSNPELGSVTLL